MNWSHGTKEFDSFQNKAALTSQLLMPDTMYASLLVSSTAGFIQCDLFIRRTYYIQTSFDITLLKGVTTFYRKILSTSTRLIFVPQTFLVSLFSERGQGRDCYIPNLFNVNWAISRKWLPFPCNSTGCLRELFSVSAQL